MEYRIRTPEGEIKNIKLTGEMDDNERIYFDSEIPDGEILVNTDKTTIFDIEMVE